MKKQKKSKTKKRYHSSSPSSRSSSSFSSHKHKQKKEKQKQKHRSDKKHSSNDQSSKDFQKKRKRYSEQSDRSTKRQRQKPLDKQKKREHKQFQNKQNSIKRQEKYQTKSEISRYAHEQQNNSSNDEQQRLKISQEEVKIKKQLPCFEPSGILLQYYNSREGVSLRFHQPPEARQPDQQWRIYIFKGQQVLKPIVLTKSSYLIGKDDRVVDILAQNPSISRQHCVIQFRLIQKRQTEGDYLEAIKPYVMDLESTNGTLLNDEKIQPGRYYELLHKDVLKFGFSERQYVIVKWDERQQEVVEGE